jgi:hypothetical protein
MASLIDVRDVLGAVRAPTLVLHRRDDIDVHIEEGRYLAERIPGARFVELEGSDHYVGVDPDQILDPVEEFVRELGSPAAAETSLTTMLAVRMERPIDPAWMRGMVREVLEAHRGVPAVTEAANVLATFDGPGRAIRCAQALAEHIRTAGLDVSIGLHTAEVARRGAQVSGPAVELVQAVADRAATGEVWVTSTVRDLTAGSTLSFEPRTELELPGLGRRIQLDAVT